LDNADAATFLKIKIALAINMSDKLVWAFPTSRECSSLAWLLHFHHRHSYNQTFKQMLTLPGCVSVSLLLLCLLHVEQDAFMYALNQLHLLQELRCSNLDINTIINYVSESIQTIISSKTR
jgi:hypothetical protein